MSVSEAEPVAVSDTESGSEAATEAVTDDSDRAPRIDRRVGLAPPTASALGSAPTTATVPVAATVPATVSATDTDSATSPATVSETPTVSDTVTDKAPAPATAPSGASSPGLGRTGPPCKNPDDCTPRVHLAIALDLHPENASETRWMGDMLEGFLQEVKPATGMATIRDHHRGYQWVVSWTDLEEWMADSATEPDDELAALVAETLKRLRSGGTLLVVTDGLGPRSKPRWAEVRSAAKDADVSILVAGLWSDEFASGLRRDLRKLADATGGAVFYLQGPEQADILIDRFRSIVEE